MPENNAGPIVDGESSYPEVYEEQHPSIPQPEDTKFQTIILSIIGLSIGLVFFIPYISQIINALVALTLVVIYWKRNYRLMNIGLGTIALIGILIFALVRYQQALIDNHDYELIDSLNIYFKICNVIFVVAIAATGFGAMAVSRLTKSIYFIIPIAYSIMLLLVYTCSLDGKEPSEITEYFNTIDNITGAVIILSATATFATWFFNRDKFETEEFQD